MSPAAAPRNVVVYNCATDAVSAPKTFTLACGDGNSQLTGLRWTGWGAARDTATGRLRLNMCTPTCVSGKWVSIPATVTVGRRANQEANQAYRRMTIRLKGAVPKGQARVETYRISSTTGPSLVG